MLEGLVHASSSFVTLTYADEFLPDGGNLLARDMQLFMKRLRKKLDRPVRFYGVGEYGEQNFRPHYHLALFGVDVSEQPLIEACWPLGIVHIGDLTFDSAQYLCGYVTKKMTHAEDKRLGGKRPEFARMSLRPGIGAASVQQIADALSNRSGWDEIHRLGDVPTMLRHGQKNYPLGRYLRRRLREAMNFETLLQSKEASIQQSEELLALWKDYVSNSKSPKDTLAGMIVDLGKQKVRNVETRARIFSKRETL